MEKIISIIIGIIAVLKLQFNSDDSKVGIKETQEVIIGANEISVLLLSKFRDGVQFSDFTEMYSALKDDEEFKAKISAAYDNYKAIPEEVSDIDALEGLTLAEIQLQYSSKYIAALSKKEA